MEHILIHLVSALVRWLTTSSREETEQEPTYQGRPGANPYTPAPPGQERPMSDVEDYLRRVRGQQSAPPPVRQPPARVESMPIDVEILDEPPTGRLVSQHVSQHLSNRQFVERAAHMGDDVEQADEQMDQRLHQKFDHRLGRLAGEGSYHVQETQTDPNEMVVAGDSPSVPSSLDIVSLLKNPANFRQALIVSEILKPAHERVDW
jgi:hypothetical protein